jgi:hypothetical protein
LEFAQELPDVFEPTNVLAQFGQFAKRCRSDTVDKQPVDWHIARSVRNLGQAAGIDCGSSLRQSQIVLDEEI